MKELYIFSKKVYERLSKSRSKASKDPNRTKRAAGPYIIFSREHRAQVKAELEARVRKHPSEASNKEMTVTKELGRRWKALSAEEQEVYKRKSADLQSEIDANEAATSSPSLSSSSVSKKKKVVELSGSETSASSSEEEPQVKRQKVDKNKKDKK